MNELLNRFFEKADVTPNFTVVNLEQGPPIDQDTERHNVEHHPNGDDLSIPSPQDNPSSNNHTK